MDPFDITKYLDIARRRKYWGIIPFLVAILCGLGYFLIAPKIYEAKTLILVQPQRVPEQFVRSIVSTSVEERVRTITQQVTSRTNLEKIIHQFYVFEASGRGLGLDLLVSRLRKRIRIQVAGQGRNTGPSTFTIAFRDKDPKIATEVTNTLASNFMSENLKIRESQAMGTSTFLSDELESVRNRLEAKEDELKKYQEHYMGGLPQQLQTNLAILGRLQAQLDQYSDNLKDAENRKILIQKQVAESKKAFSISVASTPGQGAAVNDPASLRNQLASLETRYTEKHPDVIRLKKLLARIEKEQLDTSESGTPTGESSKLYGVDPALRQELENLEITMDALKADIEKTKSQIKFYQRKVEETPKREQELLSLNRDYGNLKGLYDSLLNRKLEAEISVSMERKQKGEQFRVIDPAKIPTYPIEPDMKKIILFPLVLGLVFGGGLAYFIELMDTSFKTPEEVEKELQVPVLVSMPIRYTGKELRTRKMIGFLKAASLSVGFLFSATAIVFATKGIDATMNYVKTALANLGIL